MDDAPNLLALHQSDPALFPVLLNSVSSGEEDSHYDVLFAMPGAAISLWADQDGWRLEQSGVVPASIAGTDFLSALDAWFNNVNAIPAVTSELPFCGGWFVYLGYELAAQIEPSLKLPLPSNEPIAVAQRMPAAIVRRTGRSETTFVVAESRELHDALLSKLVSKPARFEANPIVIGEINEDPPHAFMRAVDAAKEAIAAGDIYQANLSRQWTAQLVSADTSSLYASLCRSNPAPFAALANLGSLSIVSSSPERLVSVRGRNVATRPIAGTRPRDIDPHRDQQLLDELLASPKEQAEHVMLIDLERNDLGRICQAGTVRVDEYMGVETYRHVHHIVSNVIGELAPEITPGEVIRALFPGGTITGCPKVRCMQLIADLEGVPRGAYTGSLGYLNLNGDMDFNILIRTLSVTGEHLSFRAGAGIVADSIADLELAETRAKARGLIAALKGEGS